MRRPDATLTHLGFYVRDLAKMAAFYQHVMGMVITDRGEAGGRSWMFLSRDPAEHHQIVLATGRPADAFALINQISFRLGSLEDLRTYHAQLAEEAVADLEAVTHGNSWSVYFLDPEANRIELYAKSPWYVAQPLRIAVDMRRSVAELQAESEALTRDDPSRMPMDAWERMMRERISAANS